MADRSDATKDAVRRDRLPVKELRALEWTEAGHLAKRAVAPVLVVTPRRSLLDAIHHAPHRVDPRLAPISSVPDESQSPADA